MNYEVKTQNKNYILALIQWWTKKCLIETSRKDLYKLPLQLTEKVSCDWAVKSRYLAVNVMSSFQQYDGPVDSNLHQMI